MAHWRYYSIEGIYGGMDRYFALPLRLGSYRISSSYGRRYHPIFHRRIMHEGVDMAAPRGTAVHAAMSGKILYRFRSSSAGNMITLKNSQYVTRYFHMDHFAKGQHVGSYIKKGEVIGYVGSTGHSTGPHLHFEIRNAKTNRTYDPMKKLHSVVEAKNMLKGEEKGKFDIYREEIDRLYIAKNIGSILGIKGDDFGLSGGRFLLSFKDMVLSGLSWQS